MNWLKISIICTILSACGEPTNEEVYPYTGQLQFHRDEVKRLTDELDRIGLQFTNNDVTKISKFERLDLALVHYGMCKKVRDDLYLDLLNNYKQLQLLENNLELNYDSKELAKRNFNCKKNEKYQTDWYLISRIYLDITEFIIFSSYQLQHSDNGLTLKRDRVKLNFSNEQNLNSLNQLISRIGIKAPNDSSDFQIFLDKLLVLLEEEITKFE